MVEYEHIPVMAGEAIEGLNIKRNPDGVFLDATLGGAGHARLILSRLSERGTLLGIDRDKYALDRAGKTLGSYFGQYILVHGNFCDFREIAHKLNIEKISGAILDLGVSSFQFDNPDRGFSYSQNSKLDMRMNQDDNLTAYTVVNTYSEERLTDIILRNGEERWAKRIADFIIAERKIKPIETTFELVSVIKKAVPKSAREGGPHPAKRTFQAIRIEVNNELAVLDKAIANIAEMLEPGGRICVITFHSLEDRIVKNAFKRLENPCVCPPGLPLCACGNKPILRRVTGKPTLPGECETADNRRARSSKLRIAERI